MFINRNWTRDPSDFTVVSREVNKALKETD
jgi:hypothetical protein